VLRRVVRAAGVSAQRPWEAIGLKLPAPLMPPGNFQAVKVHGGLAYVSGHGPFDGATVLVQGLVGRDLSSAQGATPRA